MLSGINLYLEREFLRNLLFDDFEYFLIENDSKNHIFTQISPHPTLEVLECPLGCSVSYIGNFGGDGHICGGGSYG